MAEQPRGGVPAVTLDACPSTSLRNLNRCPFRSDLSTAGLGTLGQVDPDLKQLQHVLALLVQQREHLGVVDPFASEKKNKQLCVPGAENDTPRRT